MPALYDLIIIGGGMTGLSAGISWALNRDTARHPVLLLEMQPHTGGYATTYRRKEWLIDTCQMFPDISDILRYFSIDLPAQRFDDPVLRLFIADTAAGRVTATALPAGEDRMCGVFAGIDPDGGETVTRFFNRSVRMARALLDAKLRPGPLDVISMLLTKFPIVSAAGKTFDRYLDKTGIRSSLLRDTLSLFSEMAGLPGRDIAALAPVSVMNALLKGGFRPEGGFGRLPEKLTGRFTALGGEVRTRSEVSAVLHAHGHVTGVRLTDGATIGCGQVISTVDAQVLAEKLVGIETLNSFDRRYAAKVQRSAMSPSTFTANLCLDGPFAVKDHRLDAGYSVLSTGGTAFTNLFDACRRGGDGMTAQRFHIGLSCACPAGPDRPVLTLATFPVAAQPWISLRTSDREGYNRAKQARADMMIDIVQRYLVPGLRDRVRHIDIAIPAPPAFCIASLRPARSTARPADSPPAFSASPPRVCAAVVPPGTTAISFDGGESPFGLLARIRNR